MGEATSERRQAFRRAKDNGWHEAKALVMDKLVTIGADVKDLRKGMEVKLQRLEGKIDEKISHFHIAPCREITEISKDSGKQSARIKALEEGQKETTRGIRWLIGIGLTIVGLLLGVLYRG